MSTFSQMAEEWVRKNLNVTETQLAVPSASLGIPPPEPESWREPFVRWLDSACVLNPRAFGGVTALHLSYCEWEISQDGVPCNREIFERLLAEWDFLMGEVHGTLLVSGLALREDVEAVGS